MVSIWIISLGHSILKLILSASNCLLDLAVRFAGVPDKLIAKQSLNFLRYFSSLQKCMPEYVAKKCWHLFSCVRTKSAGKNGSEKTGILTYFLLCLFLKDLVWLRVILKMFHLRQLLISISLPAKKAPTLFKNIFFCFGTWISFVLLCHLALVCLTCSFISWL